MKYLFLEKPSYNPETETLSPDYRLEDGVFVAGWKVEPKPDEDGYVPTHDEQPEGEPTLRERIARLETATAAICDAMNIETTGGV